MTAKYEGYIYNIYVFLQRTAVPDDGDIVAVVTRLIAEEDIAAFTIMFVMQSM
jgi:hypothetical protein